MKFVIAFLALGLVASGMALPSPFPHAQGMFPAEGGEVLAPPDAKKTRSLMIQKPITLPLLTMSTLPRSETGIRITDGCSSVLERGAGRACEFGDVMRTGWGLRTRASTLWNSRYCRVQCGKAEAFGSSYVTAFEHRHCQSWSCEAGYILIRVGRDLINDASGILYAFRLSR